MRFVRLLAITVAMTPLLFAETQLGTTSRAPVRSRPILRNTGIIFSGTALKIEHLNRAGLPGITQITFRVDSAVRGVRPRQLVKVREWEGLWSTGERYREGNRVLLFLYPNSKLGLTSPVGGALGRYRVDNAGRVLVRSVSGVQPKPVNLRSFVAALRRTGGE